MVIVPFTRLYLPSPNQQGLLLIIWRQKPPLTIPFTVMRDPPITTYVDSQRAYSHPPRMLYTEPWRRIQVNANAVFQS